jgi:Carbohydrate binding module (family 35)
VVLVAAALIGCVALMAAIYPLWPAERGVPDPVVAGRPAMSEPDPLDGYSPGQVLASQPGSPAGAASPEPSAVRSPERGAPPPVRRAGTPGPPTPAASAFYEAEAGILGGDARVRNVPGASGAQVVTHVGDKAANTVTLNGISVAGAGTYQLTIVYIAGDGTRSADLGVNGGTPQRITFGETANWSTVGSLTLAVALQAGANSIQFGNPKSKAPDLDMVTVR